MKAAILHDFTTGTVQRVIIIVLLVRSAAPGIRIVNEVGVEN